nr:MAG TPA: hypothetical protein [Caudoviricetes sp.]
METFILSVSIFPYMYIKEVMGLWPIGACSRRYI